MVEYNENRYGTCPLPVGILLRTSVALLGREKKNVSYKMYKGHLRLALNPSVTKHIGTFKITDAIGWGVNAGVTAQLHVGNIGRPFS